MCFCFFLLLELTNSSPTHSCIDLFWSHCVHRDVKLAKESSRRVTSESSTFIFSARSNLISTLKQYDEVNGREGRNSVFPPLLMERVCA